MLIYNHSVSFDTGRRLFHCCIVPCLLPLPHSLNCVLQVVYFVILVLNLHIFLVYYVCESLDFFVKFYNLTFQVANLIVW